MNIRDTAQKAIDDEENRPDDPMDIDYTLYNLSRQLPGVPTGRIVNRANTKKKPKPKPKKGARKTKKVARHIIINQDNNEYEYEEEDEDYEDEEEDEDEEEYEEEETYIANSVKKKDLW